MPPSESIGMKNSASSKIQLACLDLGTDSKLRGRAGSPASGFSLVELLVVIGVMALLVAFSGPMVGAIKSSNSVNRAASNLSQTMELARAYAMTHNTYVRVALGQVNAGVSGRVTPATVAWVIGATDGTLSANSAPDMIDPSKWRPLAKPLIMENFCMYDGTLNAQSPSTVGDAVPSGTDIKTFSRNIPSLGTVNFNSIIQFNPSGEACVIQGQTARYIKIACDQPLQPSNATTAQNKNPFILRLSGVNGRIDILRKENMQ